MAAAAVVECSGSSGAGHDDQREQTARLETRPPQIYVIVAINAATLQIDAELLQEGQEIIGVLFFDRQDALHQTPAGDVLVAEPTSDLAI